MLTDANRPSPSFDVLMSDGVSHVREFRQTGDLDVLAAAFHDFRQAAGVGGSSEDRAAALSNLCAALQLGHDHGLGADVLDEAVSAGRKAVRLTDGASADRADRLSNLDLALQARFERGGRLADIRDAVRVSRLAAAGRPAEDPRALRAWCNHMAALNTMFVHSGNLRHAREAARIGRRALGRSDGDDAARESLSGNLAVALLSVYEKTGDGTLLDECRTLLIGVISSTGDARIRSALQSNLCLVERTRYEHSADRSVLADAIDTGAAAVADLPPGHPYLAATHGNLSLALHAWFGETGDLDSLRRAVGHGRNALAATPPGHPDLAGRLSNLGILLRSYIERTRDPAAARDAVEFSRRAMGLAADGGPFRLAAISTYALLLRTLSSFIDDEQPLREAAVLSESVLAATATHDRERPGRLSNHMIILRSLYDRTGDRVALEQAVAAGRSALDLLGVDDATAASVLANLGRAMSTLADLDGDKAMSRDARLAYHRAARMSAAAAMLRIWAYRCEADLATRHGDHDAAVAALELAVVLVPRIAGRYLDRRDREHELGRINGFAAQIAAACVAAGRPDRAVELIEQVRGLLVGEAMRDRFTDITALTRRAPRLAAHYARLVAWFRADVGRSADPTDPAPVNPAQAARRARMDQEWIDLLERLRRMRGFETFLLPEPAALACRHARQGPVVYAYAHESGCGVIALRDDPAHPARAVTCTSVTADEVFRQANRFRTATAATASEPGYAARVAAQREMSAVLEWLWETYAAAALDVAGTNRETPERLWWCPIGVLSYLPLHAAGHHRERSGRTVFDRVVSSYTPTLGALAHARRVGSENATSAAALVVCASAAPDVSPLVGADAEADAVAGYLSGAEVLRGAEARYDAVLDALPRRAIVHFACHGVADWQYPAASRILLTDHRTAPLTLRELAGLGPFDGALCYLSACSTADATPSLADQAIHLTSAFQVLGYRHVVGTLWPVNDRIAQTVAGSFYAALALDPDHLPVAESARFLRDAARNVRDAMPSSPQHWASYVHAGA
ncbi:CHAT domain-containing protein [Dactylosporangium sp. AC04546]|uniref:CHAT domain-containing protein n=1 Tax=Dactylosporangium sp. AC04546 TaxID=2862460 RepID=UPI001EDD56F7|nr:CHAT domain-containing protein [Dactylosporangium sp. AC04546]WVK86889.1 CHAT domain-containing protein [Dactylosporangium sp. AC04546]